MNENEIVDEMTEEMTENEENIISCINLHINSILEETVTEYYVTEENATTVRGKYWNQLWVNDEKLTDKELDVITKGVYFHCLLRH